MNTKPLYALPQRQRDAMQAIIDHIIEKGESPTLEEIGERIGAHKANVRELVLALENREYITRTAFSHRSITIVEP